MEPERKIEKWLRAYAKKRRSQAGAPDKMHPATRRLLQGEIARSIPAPDKDDESDTLSLWEVVRQQWVFLLSFAICVFLGAVMFFQTARNIKNRAEHAMAMNEKSLGKADQTTAGENNGQMLDSLRVLPEGNLARKDLTNNSPSLAINNTPVPQPESASAAIPTESSASVPAMAPPSVMLSDNGGSAPPPPPISTAPVESPAAQTKTANGQLAIADEPDKENSATTFSAQQPAVGGALFLSSAQPQVNSQSLNSFRNGAPSQSLPILEDFQVQQNGNAIRVVDADGSVYEGSLQVVDKPDNAAGEDKEATKQQFGAMQNAVNVATGIPSPPAGQAQAVLSFARHYFFKVKGMNLTLKQSVVFTGSLMANSAATMNPHGAFATRAGGGGGGFGGAGGVSKKGPSTNEDTQLSWSNLRIAGTAVVNNTNRVEINATPIAPAKK
jgi:hypothetical protein